MFYSYDTFCIHLWLADQLVIGGLIDSWLIYWCFRDVTEPWKVVTESLRMSKNLWTTEDVTKPLRMLQNHWGCCRTIEDVAEPLRMSQNHWGCHTATQGVSLFCQNHWGCKTNTEDVREPLRMWPGHWGYQRTTWGDVTEQLGCHQNYSACHRTTNRAAEQ